MACRKCKDEPLASVRKTSHPANWLSCDSPGPAVIAFLLVSFLALAFSVCCPAPVNFPSWYSAVGSVALEGKVWSVVVGQSEAQEIVLTNTGTASTSVSAISIGGAAFKVSGLKLPVSLAAGRGLG